MWPKSQNWTLPAPGENHYVVEENGVMVAGPFTSYLSAEGAAVREWYMRGRELEIVRYFLSASGNYNSKDSMGFMDADKADALRFSRLQPFSAEE